MGLRRAAIAQAPRDRTSLARFFTDLRRYRPLTKEHERDIARRAKRGEDESMHELIESNLAFVVKVAARYRNLGVPFEDLLSEGSLGLLEAARRYDASRGTKFVTYAIWWIRKAVIHAVTEHGSLVRVPANHRSRLRDIREAESTLRRTLGRKPERQEISAYLESSLSRVDQALRHSVQRVSLDDPLGANTDTRVADRLVDTAAPNAEDDLIRHEASVLIESALGHLPPQERTVIVHRFGMAGKPALTLKETGRRMRLSRERVRQIECQAKSRLRGFCERRMTGR